MMDCIEIIDLQNSIIKLQSDVIYELYSELMKYVSLEELERIPVKKKIDLTAGLRKDLFRMEE